MKVLSGKKAAAEIKEWCKNEVSEMKEKTGSVPHLLVLQYGEDAASKAYVNRIKKNCETIGIEFEYQQFTSSTDDFLEKLQSANEDPDITSIMVQQPLPE